MNENRYVKLATLCEIYEVHKDFFLRRKDEFIQNIHYIKKDKTIRWNLREVQNWWEGSTLTEEEKDSIFNKILP